tara:strand:- start:1116 stop:1787 length:672 start_codon:yes stop_codon:yes gene_type:complete
MANWPNIASKLTATTLLIVGVLLTIQAGWLPIKGWLSQQLIHYSWQQSMAAHQRRQNPLQKHQQDSEQNLDQDKLNRHKLNKPIAIKPWPWADTFPIAELVFQRLAKSIVVLNGGDPTTLAFSAGAIAPFNQTNVTKPFVVAGHRDSHFAFLEDIAMKDVISLTDTQGKVQLYQVEGIDIVDASSGQLPLLANEASLVLITCYPFDGSSSEASERYVITARQL